MIYEYKCQKCNKIVERYQTTSIEQSLICDCGGDMKRIISKSNFKLVGPGFHCNDYPKNKNGGDKK